MKRPVKHLRATRLHLWQAQATCPNLFRLRCTRESQHPEVASPAGLLGESRRETTETETETEGSCCCLKCRIVIVFRFSSNSS